MSENLTVLRSLDEITADLSVQLNQFTLCCIEIGKLINEAKTVLGGNQQLESWLKENFDISISMAKKYSCVANKFSKSSPGNFGISKLYLLSSLPDDERDTFIESTHIVNDVEKTVADMSKQELEELIKECKITKPRKRKQTPAQNDVRSLQTIRKQGRRLPYDDDIDNTNTMTNVPAPTSISMLSTGFGYIESAINNMLNELSVHEDYEYRRSSLDELKQFCLQTSQRIDEMLETAIATDAEAKAS